MRWSTTGSWEDVARTRQPPFKAEPSFRSDHPAKRLGYGYVYPWGKLGDASYTRGGRFSLSSPRPPPFLTHSIDPAGISLWLQSGEEVI